MRCYSCDSGLGDKPYKDPDTGRYYCETCREIIWDTIARSKSEAPADKDDLDIPSEIELEALDSDLPPNEDNWWNFNLPGEGDDY